MKKLLLYFMALSSLIAAAVVGSCAKDDTDDSVSFSAFSVVSNEIRKLYVGSTEQIEVETDPSVDVDGNVKFSVSPISPNKLSVVVDDEGVVTGVEAGESIVAVSSMDGTWMELVSVTVCDIVSPVTSISISGTYSTNSQGQRYMDVFTSNLTAAAGIFVANISPEEATTQEVKWSCVDEGTGSTISEAGDFSPGTTIGEVTITATLFDSYAFYDDDYTEEDLDDADLVASYTYTDELLVIFTEGYLNFASNDPLTLEITSAPYTIEIESISVPTSTPVVEWTSTNLAVVSVDDSGVVTVNGAGTAIVTASCYGVSDSVEITVDYVALSSLEIAQGANATVDCGVSEQLTVDVNDNADSRVTWSIVSDDDNTGSSINANTGLFTAGSYKGDVVVRATSSDNPAFTDDITITVNVPVVSISLPSAITAAAGSFDLGSLVVFNPSDPSNSSLTWSNATNGVVTVSGNVGDTITVTATSQDNASAVATCVITVGTAAAVDSVSITGSDAMTITNVSATQTLTANTSVIWSSSDTNIATIDSSTGVVTAIAEGTVTITAKSLVDPTKSSSLTIVVSPTLVSSFDVSNISIVVGKSTTVSPTIAPATATYKGYTIEVASGAENILFDAETGVVIGNAIGSATLTITPEDTTKSAVTCTVTVASGTGIGNLEEGEGSFLPIY